MKEFRNYLLEGNTWSAFNLARVSMPQVEIESFKKHLEQLSISYWIQPGSSVENIQPTQTDFNQDKVNKIISGYLEDKSITNKTIICSSDNFVLDGHHRYYAAKQLQARWKIMFVNLPINKLLKLAIDFNEKEE